MKNKKSQLEVELDILVQEIECATAAHEKPVSQKNRKRRQRKANLRKKLNSTTTHNVSKCALCNAMLAEDGHRLFYCAGCRKTRSRIALDINLWTINFPPLHNMFRYCSLHCHRQDWKLHKIDCTQTANYRIRFLASEVD